MLAAVHTLAGKKVDVITTPCELSKPELDKKRLFFDPLKPTVGGNGNITTKKHYTRDIVFRTTNNFIADILRDEFKK